MLQSFRPLLELGTDHRIIPGSYMPFLENQSADIYMTMLERWLRTINKMARKNKCLVDPCLLISKTLEKNLKQDVNICSLSARKDEKQLA